MKPAISVGGRTGTAHNSTADEWGTSRRRGTGCDRGTPRLQSWEDVRTSDDAEVFRRVFLTVFDIDPEATPDQSAEGSADDRVHRFLGRVDGQAVAIGGAYRAGEVANVFGMGVLEEFRGRGIGSAICSSALRTARERGCALATLESTPMAVPVYERLGFETVVEYHLFDVVEAETHGASDTHS